jgi:1-aminocyclopropane-1-carboxylate deaminase/D-cysteine desulfhydrase-like pyridoxal-dependent ACC family enzyme
VATTRAARKGGDVIVRQRAGVSGAVPSVDLGVWRTPVERVPRLAERVGLRPEDLWVKRDDWLGLGGGGSKLRKLEFLCAHALEQGTTVLVTGGAAQSNYCRLTAASARRLGLGVVLVLEGDGPTGPTGNLALDGLFQADVRWAGDIRGSGLDDMVAAVADELRARGERPAVLPFGGSNALAARGYLVCAAELEEQAPAAEHVVVAVGSGATMAGLVAGLGAGRVLGVDSGAVPDAPARVATVVEELTSAGLSWAPGDTTLRLDRSQVGPGYEKLTDRARRALDDAASCEGLVLDPVYTAKALAGIAAAVERNEIRPGERTVFVHTGGLPGLFGHTLASELAARTAR